MKRHPDPALATIVRRPAHPIAGAVLWATLLLLLTLAPPLFAQSAAGRAPGATNGSTQGPQERAAHRAEATRIAAFDRIWSDYREGMWFYGEEGRRTVPTADLDWLVVRLAKQGEPGQAAPYGAFAEGDDHRRSFEEFNGRYGDSFSHMLRDPALAPAIAAYRLRHDLPAAALPTLLTRLRQDRQVGYVHPAWKVADRLYAPLEEIDLVWKTAANEGQRQALLAAVGAVAGDDADALGRQRIAVAPGRQSVWQSANLLAEDILVERASPLLMVLEPPVGVRFELAMNGAAAGTPIPFTLEIRFSDRVKIESSTVADLHLKPAGIFRNLYHIGYDAPLSAIDLNRSPIRITGHITIYATGEYNLPAIPVYYTDSEAPKRRIERVETAPEPLRIAAMIPTGKTGFELLAAGYGRLSAGTPAGPRAAGAMLIAGLVLSGLSIAAAWPLRARYRQAKQQADDSPLDRSRDGVDAAVAALQRHRGLPELADLGVSLKGYLAEFAGLDQERRGGSHASFLRRIESALPASFRAAASELLASIEQLLAQGEQGAIPDDLAERGARLVDALQAVAAAPPNSAGGDGTPGLANRP